MWIIEKSGDWIPWIRMVVADRVPVARMKPGDLPRSLKEQPALIAVEFDPDCIDSWFSLFDKSSWKFENSVQVLLGAPRDRRQSGWSREIGFGELVDDLPSLRRVLNRVLADLSIQLPARNFREEMLRRIPWS